MSTTGTGNAAVTSINGDTTAAQTIAINANTGLQLATSSGTTTFSLKGFTSITDSATPTLDASLNTKFYLASTQNNTMSITNPTDGQIIVLLYKAITSARTLTISSLKFGSSVVALTATTASKFDLITLVYSTTVGGWMLGGYDKDYV